jgi:hypothetical protein
VPLIKSEEEVLVLGGEGAMAGGKLRELLCEVVTLKLEMIAFGHKLGVGLVGEGESFTRGG